MLIVDMPMPSRCGECPLLYMDIVTCTVTGKDCTEYGAERPSWCPIVGELPDEHGDLIDRDEAFYDIKRFICNGCNRVTEDDCMTCITKGIQDILCYIKPIIVAERKDDEQID